MIQAAVATAARRTWVSSKRLFRQYTSVVISNVYPDVSASAACVRTNSIVQGLARLHSKNANNLQDENGDKSKTTNRVYYATSVDISNEKEYNSPFENINPPESEHNSTGTVQMIHLPPNRSDLADKHFWMETKPTSKNSAKNKCDGVSEIGNCKESIDLVVFDRFFVEEAHSFRFREAFPNSALVMDMQDMHSLRWGRQAIVEAWDKNERQQHKHNTNWDPLGCLPRVMEYLPTAGETKNDRFVRELASIHRSDLVLVCSPKEMHFLNTVYNVPNEKLCLASFFVEEHGIQSLPQSPSDGIARFVFCGGFKHAPNADAVRILIDFVWPKLRSELPNASLHIYGAFCPDQLLANSRKNECDGIFVHGYEPELATIFGQDGGILLAPLRFGAGIKGKIIDAWTFGMPVVTTPIGSEGMTISNDDVENDHTGDDVFGGSIASNIDEFCEKAINLAKNPESYQQAQNRGRTLLRKLFSASENWEKVQKRLLDIIDADYLFQQRKEDYTQAMLWHQSLRSTEYFSRWIELKETVARDGNRKQD